MDVAELAADDRSEGGDLEYSNASATLATLAGIAAADAACCRELGERSRGGDHHQAEQLLAQITPGGNEAAKHLRRLINLKDDAQYGFYTISGADLRRALRAAQALVKYTDDLSSRAAN
ncbi:MAG: hypothetical protein ACRDMA_04815 [Solirubrobacterales bacterium]